MIAILLDQGLAPRAAILLRQRCIEAVHVSEIGMPRQRMRKFSMQRERWVGFA